MPKLAIRYAIVGTTYTKNNVEHVLFWSLPYYLCRSQPFKTPDDVVKCVEKHVNTMPNNRQIGILNRNTNEYINHQIRKQTQNFEQDSQGVTLVVVDACRFVTVSVA
jgi:hypothetical protein